MNPKRMMTGLLIALAISGACTYLLSRKIDSHASQRRPVTQTYAAPARALQAGEILKTDNLEMIDWPVSSPITGAFSRIDEVVGRVVLYPLDKGQPILERYLALPGSGGGLAGRIPDGMRALALRSDEVVGVAGFLLPGSHLDVLVTYRADKSPEPVTTTVVQDAEVIAAGHQMEPDPAGKPATVTVVTLLLTPEDAERAVLASTQGSIHFVLRNGSDKSRTHGAPIPLSQLSGELPGADQPGAHAAKVHVHRAAARIYEVQTVLGDKETTDKFSGGPQQ